MARRLVSDVPATALTPPRTVVLIVADDLGWGDAGCYNSDSKVPTPALDRLGREGLRLSHARTPSALCTPSRYAMLTACSHWRTGASRPLVDPYGPPLIEPGTATLASVLRDAGYRIHGVGKWHLGLRYPSVHGGWTMREEDVAFAQAVAGGPTSLGFDTFFGTAGCSTSDPPYTFLEDDRFHPSPTVQAPPELTSLPGVLPGTMAPDWDVRLVDDILVDRATELLAAHARDRSGPPQFLYLALSAPHNPWEAPEALQGATGDSVRGDMAAWFDRSVGRVLVSLDDEGLADDALVIVTSDHGPQYEEGPRGHRPTGPFRGRKNTVWEGGLRVPMWIRWPGRVRAGTVSDAPFVHTDLAPSLATLVGATLPRGDHPVGPSAGARGAPASESNPSGGQRTWRDGLDRSATWLTGVHEHRPDARNLPEHGQAGVPPPRPAALFECGGARDRIGAWAVIEDPWKLIVDVQDGEHSSAGPLGTVPAVGIRVGSGRLYHLEDDPGETHDRSEDAGEARNAYERLERLLRAELKAAGWASLANPPNAHGSVRP